MKWGMDQERGEGTNRKQNEKADLNLNMSIITCKVNGLNTSIKRDHYVGNLKLICYVDSSNKKISPPTPKFKRQTLSK